VLPASAVAAILVISLIPGWLFLRLSEKARRPRHQSDLQEVLELVAMGVLTTGLAVALVAALRPAGLLSLDIPPADARGLRELAASVVGTVLLALGLAAVFGVIVAKTSPAPTASLVTSVWWDVLGAENVPAGRAPFVMVTLTDGRTVEGILSTYTWQSESSHYRDIALRAPIRYPAGENLSLKTSYDFLIIAGTDIEQIALRYLPK